jgi:hypothetical protein
MQLFGEWGMGNGEWEMGNGKLGIRSRNQVFPKNPRNQVFPKNLVSEMQIINY